jgi:hypothetical protein
MPIPCGLRCLLGGEFGQTGIFFGQCATPLAPRVEGNIGGCIHDAINQHAAFVPFLLAAPCRLSGMAGCLNGSGNVRVDVSNFWGDALVMDRHGQKGKVRIHRVTTSCQHCPSPGPLRPSLHPLPINQTPHFIFAVQLGHPATIPKSHATLSIVPSSWGLTTWQPGSLGPWASGKLGYGCKPALDAATLAGTFAQVTLPSRSLFRDVASMTGRSQWHGFGSRHGTLPVSCLCHRRPNHPLHRGRLPRGREGPIKPSSLKSWGEGGCQPGRSEVPWRVSERESGTVEVLWIARHFLVVGSDVMLVLGPCCERHLVIFTSLHVFGKRGTPRNSLVPEPDGRPPPFFFLLCLPSPQGRTRRCRADRWAGEVYAAHPSDIP